MRLCPFIDGITEFCMELCLPVHKKISGFFRADGGRRIFFAGKRIRPKSAAHHTEHSQDNSVPYRFCPDVIPFQAAQNIFVPVFQHYQHSLSIP